MSVLQKLTEGIINKDVSREGQAILTKWEKTGLLEGLNDSRTRQNMSVLLENQAKELLREASAMAAGDVEGFAAVAFPIVRRVFGGLIANDLISVQPMSLPSGLIFFLDFTHESGQLGAAQGASLYGGNVVGRALTGGVDLSPATRVGPGGHYDFGNGYSSPTGSRDLVVVAADRTSDAANKGTLISALTDADKALIQWDPDLLGGDQTDRVAVIDFDIPANFNREACHLVDIVGGAVTADAGAGKTLAPGAGNLRTVRRLSRLVRGGGTDGADAIRLVLVATDGNEIEHNDNNAIAAAANETIRATVPLADSFVEAASSGGGLGAVMGGDPWGLEEPARRARGDGDVGGGGELKASHDAQTQRIPEIDIKVDSIAVTAITKKLKAKWTPELGQDLNAYHNLDAEVELTGILSEQIALEIDRELLNELVTGATAGTRYWSRAPGLFVDASGNPLGATSAAPDFTGTVSEWYETLIEQINDVSAQIHRKTLRGGANFVVCSPEVANILEFTSGFRASVTADQDKGTIGAVKAGSLSKKFDVYVDPYFLRNVILVGRKGGSFLESGFVYAPYVPLQVTPTIFGQEDFVPRKGVMTRYAKKMVRPDMYGLVVVRGLLGEEMPN